MDKKIIMGIVVLLALIILVFMNKNQHMAGNVIAQDIDNLHQVNLAIENMYCSSCAYGVKAQLEDLEGVVSADINHKTASGVVNYDADKIDAETIAEASTVYPANVVADNKLE